MKKALLAILCVSLLLIGVSALRAADAPKVKDTFELDSPATCFKDGKKTKIPPSTKLVTLSHKKHAESAGCKECHHNMKDNNDTANANKCSTKDCHGAEEHEKDGKKVVALKDAMHNNCFKDCHKNNKDAVAKKAPTKCNECHAKAE
ncbi:MAG: cytochrome c3 family protein [bacterium]